MLYEWDTEKDRANRRHHGLGLAEGIPALEDPDAESWIDERFEYGEERVITLGRNATRVLYVVTTERSETVTRIISVRRATRYEEERYYQGLA